MGISPGMGIWEIPWDGKSPILEKFPNLGILSGIPIQEIPRRKNLEAIWVGGNGNFSLNIPDFCRVGPPISNYDKFSCALGKH